MADPQTLSDVAAAPTSAATGDTSAGSASASDVGASTDSRAIAAELLRDTEPAPAAPQAAPPPDASPTPAAATSGEDDEAAYQALLASGAVPTDRHKAVVTNTRNKTRAEVEAEARTKYGWVDDLKLDRGRADQALGLMRAFESNPEQALRTMAMALGIDLAPKAATPAEPAGPPPPDVRLDDGQEFYSAAQLAKLNEWQQAQFDKRLSAVTARFEPLIQRQIEADMRQHASAEAGTLLSKCRAEWPGFSGLEGEIKARMTADPSLSLEHAYIAAFAAKGLPALQQQHDTDRASQLHRKAAASIAPPSAPRAVTPLRDRDRTTADITAEVMAAASR